MRILSIALKNIKSHRDTELHFSAGINVLCGPNGAGKSTVFEAIGYALFGVDAQSFVGNAERFISIGAKKGEVAVTFEPAPGETFRVSRSVGTPSRWLLAKEIAGEFEVEEHKDARETETRLKELLGLDNGRPLAEQFTLVIGPFQNEFLGPFVARQAAKRRDEFDAILGIDTWRKTFNETKALASAIKAKIEALQSAIGPLKEQVAALPERREAQRGAKRELEQTQQTLETRQRELTELEVRLADSDKREQTLKALGVEIDKLKERIANGKEKIDAQKLLVAEAEKARLTVVESAAGKEAFEQAEASLNALREQGKIQRRLEREAAALDKDAGRLAERFASESRAVEQMGNELDAEERALAVKRGELAVDETLRQQALCLPQIRAALDGVRAEGGKLDGRRAGLEEGDAKLAEGICPFFGEPCLNIAEKPPGDVFSDKFAALGRERRHLDEKIVRLQAEESAAAAADQQIKALEVQLRGIEEQTARVAEKRKVNAERTGGLAALQKQQAQFQGQLAAKREELQTYGRLQADIEAAEAKQKRHQAARDIYLANHKQAEELEQRRGDLDKFEQFLEKLQGEANERETDFKATSAEYRAEEHQSLRRHKDTLAPEVGALGQKIEGLKADLARLCAEIDKLKLLEAEIAAKQASIKAYGEKEQLVKFLRNRVFRNVSASLSERFREEISRRADRIYRTIAETDEELVWGENYQIVLRDLADGALRERSDDQLSGGQTMSAVVALRLAMLQTIGARIAFFDEPTSNLDASRRENLARAFRAIDVGREEVTEHWYDQLFLISHDVAFADITDQLTEL
jgi:exonuclease SbcC